MLELIEYTAYKLVKEGASFVVLTQLTCFSTKLLAVLSSGECERSIAYLVSNTTADSGASDNKMISIITFRRLYQKRSTETAAALEYENLWKNA